MIILSEMVSFYEQLFKVKIENNLYGRIEI